MCGSEGPAEQDDLERRILRVRHHPVTALTPGIWRDQVATTSTTPAWTPGPPSASISTRSHCNGCTPCSPWKSAPAPSKSPASPPTPPPPEPPSKPANYCGNSAKVRLASPISGFVDPDPLRSARDDRAVGEVNHCRFGSCGSALLLDDDPTWGCALAVVRGWGGRLHGSTHLPGPGACAYPNSTSSGARWSSVYVAEAVTPRPTHTTVSRVTRVIASGSTNTGVSRRSAAVCIHTGRRRLSRRPAHQRCEGGSHDHGPAQTIPHNDAE